MVYLLDQKGANKVHCLGLYTLSAIHTHGTLMVIEMMIRCLVVFILSKKKRPKMVVLMDYK